MHPFAEDLGAASRQRVHPGLFQVRQGLVHGFFGDSPDLLEFDHGEGLERHARPHFLDRPDDIQVIGVGQPGVHSANHVDLGDRHVRVGLHPRPDVFGRKHVSFRIFRQGVKGTEEAAFVADVGVVQVLVTHEVDPFAVHALANEISQVADGRQVAVPVQPSPVVGRKPLARHDFPVYVLKACFGDQCFKHPILPESKIQLRP